MVAVPVRLDIAPDVLAWAIERSGVDPQVVAEKFPVQQWIDGDRKPTLKQVENFARTTHTPVGLLLLPEPPDEQLPVPDFRTMPGADMTRPTADLLDTIYLCQQRQEWYRDFALSNDEEPLEFVGSLTPGTDVGAAAQQMRDLIGFGAAERTEHSTWADALRALVNDKKSVFAPGF
jgi:hypothetical protein